MVNRVYLDSCVYIYHLEANSEFASRALVYFEKALHGQIEIIASPLVLQEIMVGVYQKKDDGREASVYNLLTTHPSIRWVDYSISIADTAARIRIACKVKTPDSIHLATAIAENCNEFVTQDRDILTAQKSLGLKMLKL